jgi:hypothetical protein
MVPARAVALACLLPCACSSLDPLAGEWSGETGSADWTNALSVAEDLTGTALMHYVQDDVTYHSGFDHEAQARGGGLYWIDLVCADDCPEGGKDFRMTCTLSDDGQTLPCEALGWYELTWERDDTP